MIFLLGLGVIFLLLAGGFLTFAWLAEQRLGTDAERAQSWQWLRPWLLRGLAVPAVIWMLMNVGFSFEFQSFMPRLQRVQGTSLWLPWFFVYVAGGLAVISSYWAAGTVGWIVWRTYRPLTGETLSQYRAFLGMSMGIMILPALLFVAVGKEMALGLAGVALLAPIVGYAPTLLRPLKMPPLYARAVARMKFGKYAEAEEEVLKQLEKREDDFNGWLMLAELYANNFNDLAEAEQMIMEVCDQPRTTTSQLSVALHKLADWHLKLKGDPEAARRALGVIENRLPGTHLARMAHLRAAQLPRTAEEYREQQVNKPVHLPALHDPLDDGKNAPAVNADQAELRKRAALLEARVKESPDEIAPREELARLCATGLGRLDDGIAHVEKLMSLPEQTAERRANWLALIGAWQLEYLQDRTAGCETLRKIVRDYPQTPTAFAARRRLLHLETEEKIARARRSPPPLPRITMGSDEA